MFAPLRWVLAAVLALPALAGCATHSPTILPPGFEGWTSTRGFDEPPLWPAGASQGYQRRLRLFLSPSLTRVTLAIRIDTTSSGRTFAYLSRVERAAGGSEILEQRRTRVSDADLARLDALVATSNLWTQYPEYWVSKAPNDVCIDGVEMVIERATPQGYRFSQANAQCTAPPGMLALAAQMIKLVPSEDQPISRFLQ